MKPTAYLFRRWLIASAAGVACMSAAVASVGAADPACTLLSPAEIEAALGIRVPPFAGSGPICSSKGAAASVIVRLAKKGSAPGPEAKGIEMLKQMGGTVDVKTFGAVTCSTVVPPATLAAQIGFNTTCSVTKGDSVAAVEVTTSAQKDMVPVEKLRPLAEAMAKRF